MAKPAFETRLLKLLYHGHFLLQFFDKTRALLDSVMKWWSTQARLHAFMPY